MHEPATHAGVSASYRAALNIPARHDASYHSELRATGISFFKIAPHRSQTHIFKIKVNLVNARRFILQYSRKVFLFHNFLSVRLVG